MCSSFDATFANGTDLRQAWQKLAQFDECGAAAHPLPIDSAGEVGRARSVPTWGPLASPGLFDSTRTLMRRVIGPIEDI